MLPLLQTRVHEIVREAVELEHEFCCEALSCALVGMNAELMGQYIEYVADRLLVALRCDKLWHSANPFDWMEMISLQVWRLYSLAAYTCCRVYRICETLEVCHACRYAQGVHCSWRHLSPRLCENAGKDQLL